MEENALLMRLNCINENYYLVFEYDTEGADTEVLDIGANFSDQWDIYYDCVTVIHHSLFDYKRFLKQHHDFPFIIKFFQNFPLFDNNQEKFLDYMKWLFVMNKMNRV